MSDYKIWNMIKKLIEEKGYSYAALCRMMTNDTSPQKFQKWKNRPDDCWNISVLLELSEVLNFTVNIKEGRIEVMENKECLKELNEDLVVTYEVYKKLDDNYSVVNLYTPTSNINYDDEPSLMEEMFVCSTKEECEESFPGYKPVKCYALLNNQTNSIENYNTIDFYPAEAEAHYYYYHAPVIEYTDDNYPVIAIFKEEGFKLVKAGGILDLDDSPNGYTFAGYTNDLKDEKCLPGFTLLPIESNSSEDFVSWATNLGYLYGLDERLYKWSMPRRYFDRDRNEIFPGDVIVKKGLPHFLDYMKDEFTDSKENISDYFKKYESIRVEGCYTFYVHGVNFSLSDLNLLEWERVDYDKECSDEEC